MRYRAPRRPADRPIQLISPRGEVRCRLRNISVTGAGIVDAPLLPPGTQVVLCVLYNQWNAHVVWHRGATMGLRFNTQLSAGDLSKLLQTSAGGQHRAGHTSGGGYAHGFQELR
ncbi:PilZ domain-containing protein [Roseobacteraceae bacterium S113]